MDDNNLMEHSSRGETNAMDIDDKEYHLNNWDSFEVDIEEQILWDENQRFYYKKAPIKIRSCETEPRKKRKL